MVCNFCFSNSVYNKANIFLGLIEYELNTSYLVDYISVHIRFDLERYLLNIYISYKALYAHSSQSGDRRVVYILIISYLIEKPFYLFTPQSFSFQILSNTFVKFSNFMFLGVVPVTHCSVPERENFVHSDCPRKRAFAPFESCPEGLSRARDG